MALEHTYLTFGCKSLLQVINYGEIIAGAPLRGGGGRLMIPVWISKPVVSRIEEEAMSLSVLYYHYCAVAGSGGSRPSDEGEGGGGVIQTLR